MKDPLSAQETPYEILGVPENATKKTIDAAFKKLLAKGKKVNVLREAWNKLSKPIDRTFENIFLYNDHFAKVQPKKLLENRKEVAEAFSKIEKKLFPHIPSIHSIALAWWRWAIYKEEERLASINGTEFKTIPTLSDSPPIEQLWTNALIRWAYLIQAKEFWDSWLEFGRKTGLEISPEELEILKQKLKSHVISLLYAYQEKYRNLGKAAEAEGFQKYEQIFEGETRLGQQLKAANVSLFLGNKETQISCGKLLLVQLELLDQVQEKIPLLMRKEPQNEALRTLSMTLSPFGHIQELFEAKKFGQVREEIGKLSPGLQARGEIEQIRSKSIFFLGNEQFQAGKTQEAFALWKESLTNKEFARDFQESIKTQIRERASAVQQHDIEGAMTLIKSANQLFKSKEFDEVLSSIITQKGFITLDSGWKKAEAAKGKGEKAYKEARTELEKGMAELKEALKIDHQNTRAQEAMGNWEKIMTDFDLFPIMDEMDAKKFGPVIPKLKAFLLRFPSHQKARDLLAYCQMQMCWYCAEAGVTEETQALIPMHRVEDSSHYSKLSVPVPRCERCKGVHDLSYYAGVALFIVLAIIAFIVFSTVQTGAKNDPAIMVFLAAFGLWWVTSWVLDGVIASGNKTNKFTYGQEHANPQSMKAKGFEFGEKPSNAR